LLTSPTELLDGLLPVLICAPPESPSEEARKIYYHADGADDNTKLAEVSDNRCTTRSAGAASKSSKASAKKSSSIQPHQCPEIHIFSSKSRITEDSDNEIVELSSPNHSTKSRTKKGPLPDIDEVVEAEARGKHTSLRPLFDSDRDLKTPDAEAPTHFERLVFSQSWKSSCSSLWVIRISLLILIAFYPSPQSLSIDTNCTYIL
jgi:hypothetical protein